MSGQTTWEQLTNFADDLERSLCYEFEADFECDSIILCGVGGSAVSGDFAADCCYAESRIPIRPVRYPKLPSWVGSRTVAVVSSYSGNTAETMEMYRQAKSAGCIVVALTSGGILKGAAESAGDRVVLLPTGMHPRHAIGYMIGYTLAIIRASGGPDVRPRISGFIPSLKDYRDENAIPEGCLARTLARELADKVPVVCADSSMRSVSFRWKTQVNENSKHVAFCEAFAEFSHRSLAQWLGTSRTDLRLVMLIGCDDGMCREASAMEDAAAELERSGAPVTVIRLGGESSLENMFRAIILGDYISFYIAEMRGIDSAEVKPVMQMKAKLSEIGY